LAENASSSWSSWEGENAVRIRFGFLNGNSIDPGPPEKNSNISGSSS